ncbi:hypothetical protein [Streptomyces sp. CAU 1734]|uniref:hypothetical protein n=1 Tax=Streptomyces sp. CAU 1734 TaxID=3140360 RepID=UPI003260E0F0
MLAETLVAVAGAGGTALVGAMATDLWTGTRDGVVQLFRGGAGEDRAAAVGAQLDDDERTMTAFVPEADAGDMRRALALVWTQRLVRLLEEHPETEAGMRALVDRLRAEQPTGEERVWRQTNTSRDHSTQFAVQGGDVIYHRDPGTATAPDHPAAP